jgi:diguanylate cyclase (GGDEF)-like protein
MKQIKFPESKKDSITGLSKRDELEPLVQKTFNECVVEFDIAKKDAVYSIILFDVDYFKSINDIFGYPQGDTVLKGMGKILSEYKESKKDFLGILGRWGGEEFLIALPYTPAKRAKYIADEIRELVAAYDFKDAVSGKETLQKRITISLGVDSVDIGEFVKNLEVNPSKKSIKNRFNKLIRNSNCALDYAKFMGKNRVELFSEYLENEISNLNAVRNFYFKYAHKNLPEIKEILDSKYLLKNKNMRNKIIKHFNFIRTEINEKDTRTQAVIADNLYRAIIKTQDVMKKEEFLTFIKEYQIN